MASPLCEVRDGVGAWTATTNGVDVTPAGTVTIRLADVSGVSTWSIVCLTTDETSDADTVTAALSVDNINKTATFTAPAAGKAYRFRSRVNSGLDVNGFADEALSTTFGVYTLTATGLRVSSVDETTESSAEFGWTSTINGAIREVSGGTGSTTNGTVTQSAAEVATTNATPTQIGSTFSLTEDTIITVDEEIRCIEEGAAKAKLWSVRRHYLNTGGTITATTQEDVAGPDEIGGATAASVSLTRTGATARTEVTGVAATSLRWSMQRQVVSLAAPTPAPAPLSVDSISPTSGLIAGGTAVTITGTGFDAGADVEFDGVTATSIVVVNSTTITCVTPAGSAGTADVTVTNPDTETDTLVAGYTYSAAFDPATLVSDGWFRASFTGAPLVGTASAGASGGRTFVDNGVHAVPAVGATVNGHDAILFTAATPTALDTPLAADSYASDTAYSGWMLCRVASVATDSANAYENATGLGSTPGGYFGVAFRSSGAVQVYHFDGGFDPAETAFTVGAAWQLVQWNFNGTTLKIRVNGGSWASVAKTTTTYAFSTEFLRLGLDAAGTFGSNVEILDLRLRAASTPDATFDDVRGYCNTRYGLSV